MCVLDLRFTSTHHLLVTNVCQWCVDTVGFIEWGLFNSVKLGMQKDGHVLKGISIVSEGQGKKRERKHFKWGRMPCILKCLMKSDRNGDLIIK